MVGSRSRVRLCAFALPVLGVALAASWPLLAQDDPAGAAVPRAYRRVPQYFGQVGLTSAQREQIYTIRGGYQDQIAALKRQMAELQARELSECEAVLTEAQQKLLESRRASRRGVASPAPAAPPQGVGTGDETEPG